MPDNRAAGPLMLVASWAILALWAVATTLYPGTPIEESLTPIPTAFIAFTILHALVGFGWKGTAAMLLACAATAFFTEWLSIHHGVPFGYYTHGDVLGAKLADVPLFIPLGYFPITYSAWIIARILVEDGTGTRARFWTPIAAALIATGFDAAGDAIGATVHGYWLYRHPTGIFGVPLTNYLGWLVTTWIIAQIFTLLAPRFARLPALAATHFWALPAVFWLIMGLQFILYHLTDGGTAGAMVTRGDTVWRITDIYEGAATVAILVMLPPAIIALARLLNRRAA